ncbi:MAG: membrane integrity-associated transporter subunit PqiC [Desulfovibrio sp.]|nr:membrane integrity-associated transporter subunit PqiC [Desulfovibrio sp.]
MQRCILSIFLLFLSALLLACGRSTPTTYYLLESSLTPVESIGLPSKSLRVAQISVPAYLDRSGIVSRVTGENRLIIAEFHAWAEPLGQGVRRVLQEALAPPLLLQGFNVLAGNDDDSGDFVLLVDIQRLDGTVKSMAVLEAHWTLQRENGKLLGRGIHVAREPLPGTDADQNQDYNILVGAQSRLLQGMAVALAQKLPPLMKD